MVANPPDPAVPSVPWVTLQRGVLCGSGVSRPVANPCSDQRKRCETAASGRGRHHELLSWHLPTAAAAPGVPIIGAPGVPACSPALLWLRPPDAVGRKGERLFAACLSLSGRAVPKIPAPSACAGQPSVPVICPAGPGMRGRACACPGGCGRGRNGLGWAPMAPLGRAGAPQDPSNSVQPLWALGVLGCWGAALCQMGTAPWGGRWGDPGGGHCLSQGVTSRR